MPEPLMIGAHFSTSKGLPAMLETARTLGADCAQIFTSSPQMWRGKHYTPAEIDAFKAAQAATGIGPVVSHDAYLINLASSDEAILVKSRLAIREEIARCGKLGLPLLVMHLGAYKGATLEEGLRTLATSLTELIPVADDAGVQLVLETTAGQGTYLGGEFGQFPQLFDMIPMQERVGVCLDTCHVFVAGYDLRDAEDYRALWAAFDREIGRDRLRVIHMNDAAGNLGSHLDRHASIGQGMLGRDAFRHLMCDPTLRAVPKILETPGDAEQHGENLRILRELADPTNGK